MTEIRFTSDIHVPYEKEAKDPVLFDPTEKYANKLMQSDLEKEFFVKYLIRTQKILIPLSAVCKC